MTVMILHGTGGNSRDQWFPWLAAQIENLGHKVWVPDLPGADEPDINKYNPFIFKNCPFEINNDTVIVGHSSGAVAALGLLQKLPGKIKVDKVILVAGFMDDLDYDPVKKMFRTWKFEWEKIKAKSRKFIIICSDNDPFVPIKQGQELQKLLGGELKVIPGQKHFSLSTKQGYDKFPELLEMI